MSSSASTAPIASSLAAAATPAECLALAAAADAAGEVELQRRCLQQAVALDRSCQDGLLTLAALALAEDDRLSTFVYLEEAARLAALPPDVEVLRERLLEEAGASPEIVHYLTLTGRAPGRSATQPLSLVVVAGTVAPSSGSPISQQLPALLPTLLSRGHRLRVLTPRADAPAPHPPAAAESALAACTSATLTVPATGSARRDNAARLRTAIAKSGAEAVIVADAAFADRELLQAALDRGIPVLHWVDSTALPIATGELPLERAYRLVPASDWLGTALRNSGYETPGMDPLPPAVALDRWFRLTLPDTLRLRLVARIDAADSAGVETVLAALAALRADGVEATLELLVASPDSGYVQTLSHRIAELNLADRVVLQPTADASAFSAAIARGNVLLATTSGPEAFPAGLLEAMAGGVVPVTTGQGGAREIVRADVDGRQVRADDAGDLARVLAGLARDGDGFRTLQRAAQARALDYSPAATAEKIEARVAQCRDDLTGFGLTEEFATVAN